MPPAVQGEEAHADYDDRDGDANPPTVISFSFLYVGKLGARRAQTQGGSTSLDRSLAYVPSASFLDSYRPKTASARMTRPIPVRISATPTTMLKIEICSAM